MLPRSGLLSQKQADYRIGFDLISSVDLAGLTASAAELRRRTLPPPFLPPLATILADIARFFENIS